MENKLNIFKIKNANIDNIRYDIPVKMENGNIVVPISYLDTNKSEKIPFFIQLPELYLEMENETLLLLLIGKDNNVTSRVINSFYNLENKIKIVLKIILKKIKHMTNFTENKFTYNSIICSSEENNDFFNDFGGIKFDNNNNDTISIFSKEKENITDTSNLKSLIGSFVASIIEINSIVIYCNNNISVHIKLHQLKLSSPKVIKNYNINEYSFVDSESENENNIHNTQLNKEFINDTNNNNYDNDNDNYDNDNNNNNDEYDNDDNDINNNDHNINNEGSDDDNSKIMYLNCELNMDLVSDSDDENNSDIEKL